MSLNAHLIGILTYYSGFAAGNRATMPPTWTTVPKPNPTSPVHLRVVKNAAHG